MEELEIKNRLKNAKNTTIYHSRDFNKLNGALRSCLNVRRYLNEDDLRADEIIAKIYYLLGEYKLSNDWYYSMLEVKESSSYYLAIYKNLVALGDTYNLRCVFENYKGLVNNFDSRLIDHLIDYLDDKEVDNIWNNYKYMFFDMVNNKEMLDLYKELVMLVNHKDFIGASKKALQLDSMAQANKYCVEFYSLVNLLKCCDKHKRQVINDNLNDIYKDLKVAVDNKDVCKIFSILHDIRHTSVKDNKLLIQGIYILIENNFLEESMSLIEDINFSKSYKEQIKILSKMLREQLFLLNLSEEELSVYDDAISMGRYYYQMDDYSKAYDTYTWGSYITNAPIFNYYIGKILYKMHRYKEARDYFLKYVEIGGSKLDKAYLYLSKIFEKYGNKKKSVHYSRYVDYCNDVMNKEFDFVSPFDDSIEQDVDKIRAQKKDNIGEEYFGEDKLEDLEHYVRLIKKGKRSEANLFLESLKKTQDKTNNQKLVLRIIDRNKKLYEQKRV